MTESKFFIRSVYKLLSRHYGYLKLCSEEEKWHDGNCGITTQKIGSNDLLCMTSVAQ